MTTIGQRAIQSAEEVRDFLEGKSISGLVVHPVKKRLTLKEALTVSFQERMKNDADFCKKIWSALANVEWKHEDGAEESYSFRAAGGLIAEIIDEGDYLDWYCCAPDGVVDLEIEERMKDHGWSFTL